MTRAGDTLERLRRGDSAAFDAVYREHRHRIYGFLVRMTGSRDLADDLFQETWLRLARGARDLHADSNLKAWLFTVARNLVRSHARLSALDRAAIDRLALRRAEPAQTTPYHTATLTETQLALERGLAGLRPKYREVLLLVVIEGMSPAEAAAVVGVTPEAMRQRLSRARAELGATLDERPMTRKAGG